MPSKANATGPTHGTNNENLFALKHVVPAETSLAQWIEHRLAD